MLRKIWWHSLQCNSVLSKDIKSKSSHLKFKISVGGFPPPLYKKKHFWILQKLCSIAISLAFDWQRTFCTSEVENLGNHLRVKLETVKDKTSSCCVWSQVRFDYVYTQQTTGSLIPSNPLTRCLSLPHSSIPLSLVTWRRAAAPCPPACVRLISSAALRRAKKDGWSEQEVSLEKWEQQ